MFSPRKTSAIVADKNKDKKGLHLAWGIGSNWAKIKRDADVVVHAKTWTQAMEDLGERTYDEIELWGHAYPGTFFIGRDGTLTDKDLCLLADHVHDDTLVWLRGCGSFHGEKGHELAMRMTEILGCRVAGHTYLIGFPWHSGGHSLRPGQRPHWSVNEGKGEHADKPLKGSGPFEPNTLWFTNTNFPDKW